MRVIVRRRKAASLAPRERKRKEDARERRRKVADGESRWNVFARPNAVQLKLRSAPRGVDAEDDCLVDVAFRSTLMTS